MYLLRVPQKFRFGSSSDERSSKLIKFVDAISFDCPVLLNRNICNQELKAYIENSFLYYCFYYFISICFYVIFSTNSLAVIDYLNPLLHVLFFIFFIFYFFIFFIFCFLFFIFCFLFFVFFLV